MFEWPGAATGSSPVGMSGWQLGGFRSGGSPMLRLTFKRRPLLFTRLVLLAAITGFAILVSVASSHPQIVTHDDACVVCTALEDNLHESGPLQDARPVIMVHFVVEALPHSQRLGVTPTLPPPSCGPPASA